MSISPGSRLGPYEILAAIGAGGMGEVYRARDPRLGRDVAIKVLPASLSADADRLRRFEQEARAAGMLNHPNITAVLDIGEHEGAPYVVQELLEGETLREALATGILPTRRAIDVGIQIAQGLAAAHDKGIVHRDLKPDNVFLTKDGRVKILDFGIAKLADTGDLPQGTGIPTAAAGTAPGMVLGTLGYMSPEQVRGKAADARSDIFSFGAVLYEMLAGRPAFQRGSPAESIAAILTSDPAPLRSDHGPGSERLEGIVRHCVEKNPEQRFQSARDLGFALTEISGIPRSASRPRRRAAIVVAGAAVLAAFLLLSLPRWRGRGDRAGSPSVHSLAVLPLENFSRDPEQEYFSDGMTEALIADLSQIRALRVISRTSVMQYKAAKKPLPEIARALNVDAIVEGSVMRSGDRVKITAQLIDGKTDRHLWSRVYERDYRDVLALQSEVARAIALEIAASMTPQEEARLASARPIDPLAHEAYLKGRYSLNKNTEPSIRQAIRYFGDAIAREPRAAPAYAGLADSYSALRSVYAAPRDVMPQAKDAALKAVKLDDALAEGHVSLGLVKLYYDFDWPGAEAEFRRAIQLNSNLAEAHDGYAMFLAAMDRRGEAVAEIDRARSLDPLSLLVITDAAWVEYLARDYRRSAEFGRKAIELDPNFWWGHAVLGLALEKLSRFDEALAEMQKARSLDQSPTVLEMLGGAYAASGRKAEAMQVLDQLTRQASKQYVCPYEVATIYAGLGDKDSALQWLKRSEDERADCAPWMKSDGKFDPLRSDPRFREILSRIGLQ